MHVDRLYNTFMYFIYLLHLDHKLYCVNGSCQPQPHRQTKRYSIEAQIIVRRSLFLSTLLFSLFILSTNAWRNHPQYFQHASEHEHQLILWRIHPSCMIGAAIGKCKVEIYFTVAWALLILTFLLPTLALSFVLLFPKPYRNMYAQLQPLLCLIARKTSLDHFITHSCCCTPAFSWYTLTDPSLFPSIHS
ncbi:hypothetical protein BCR41DRAFT_238984 [Lobosporangium transversale]|uniref:Uncharacterized protein n=1 Tax=Lobosporangium transversale TaxID=64571 RepID=A0A1Y2GVB7_9FUNG|nr:hypothetical protein BCR41DRAFT_238984 [Lobosporangium transversale]ORZ25014.1 hypothetical protein BCR41DRAFT_238984 [Lobosporangium transversale]|eukprot:XP_021883995.1 hypothetical protein BCR41DRAFT_238984 [Lobosporangium transversale]